MGNMPLFRNGERLGIDLLSSKQSRLKRFPKPSSRFQNRSISLKKELTSFKKRPTHLLMFGSFLWCSERECYTEWFFRRRECSLTFELHKITIVYNANRRGSIPPRICNILSIIILYWF